MAFNPITRLEKILFGEKVTPKTRLETAVKHAVDNSGGGGSALPVYVPFTVTADETTGDISASTTAVFADVKAEVVAKKNVIAEVALDNDITVYAPLSSKTPTVDPTVLTFSLGVDIGGSVSTPQLMQIGFAANEVKATVVDLAIATG